MDLLFNPAFWVSTLFTLLVTAAATNVFGRLADFRELRANEEVQALIDGVETVEGGAELARRWSRAYDITPRRLRPWRARKIAEEARAFHAAHRDEHHTGFAERAHSESEEGGVDQPFNSAGPTPTATATNAGVSLAEESKAVVVPGVSSGVSLAEESKAVVVPGVSSGVSLAEEDKAVVVPGRTAIVALTEEAKPSPEQAEDPVASKSSRAVVEAFASVMYLAVAAIAGGEEGRQVARQLRWDRPNFDEPYHLFREAVSNLGGAFTIRRDRIVSRMRRTLRRRLPALSPTLYALVDAVVASTFWSTAVTAVAVAIPFVACYNFLHRAIALLLVLPAGMAADRGKERARAWWRTRQARRRRLRPPPSKTPPPPQGPTGRPPF
ncbi:hypothetical protein [Phytohabitans aurantiacus]|uniref:Uncharacterized protein n=1 Tax=Phytohabitans aurantiacus TaxID=3016789 RepID=A0ABQ5QWB7_9ACTN|nr:hypothetical protein [Phytohabitans aurantiacus]GLH98863.1 hypothetical protein Pa4123_41380 [Phytohabitans aurantiacus]